MIRALFVDLGGVVLEDGFALGVRSFAQQQGFDPDTFYAACHDHPFWKQFTLGNIEEPAYYEHVQQQFPQPFDWRALVREIQGQVTLHDDVAQLLRSLKGTMPIGAISNHPAAWFAWEEQALGLAGLFDVVALSGRLHIRKPDPRIFQWALDAAKVSGADALYIDDSDKHFSGAHAVGMHTARCTTAAEIREAMKNV